MNLPVKVVNNLVGRRKHYSVCPFCGDNLWLKSCKMVIVKKDDEHAKVEGIQVCTKCLDSSDKVSGKKIEKRLAKIGVWPEEEVERIKEILLAEKLKKNHAKEVS